LNTFAAWPELTSPFAIRSAHLACHCRSVSAVSWSLRLFPEWANVPHEAPQRPRRPALDRAQLDPNVEIREPRAEHLSERHGLQRRPRARVDLPDVLDQVRLGVLLLRVNDFQTCLLPGGR
jgi:hypothetical protein